MIEEGFSDGNSVMHRLDPRVRTVVAILFSVLVATADRFSALIPALSFSFLFLLIARLPLNKVCFRLLLVNGLILCLWLFLPFTHRGEPLFALGPLTATKEGVIKSTLITVKSNAIILALMALVATMPALTLGRVMRELHVPVKFVYLFYFTFRYIDAIYREYRRQMNAIKIRGFQPATNMHTYRTYAYLLGMLLVKSCYRAERVRAAMLCRGFKGRFYDLTEFSLTRLDFIALAVMLLGLSVIGLLQWSNTMSRILF